MKNIFTKTQAVSVLNQFDNGSGQVSIFAPVESTHKYFKHSCDELEKRLKKYLDSDSISCVVEDPGA